MGVDEEQIVQMRPSLTTRTSKPTTNQPWWSLLHAQQH
jgi:phospholipase C